MTYCLDTNVVIDIFRGDQQLKSKIMAMNKYAITPIVLCELFKGAFLAQRQEEALKLVNDFVQTVDILDCNYEACELFGKWYADLKKQGKQTQEMDLMIACTALAHHSILVTRNAKDFKHIEGLSVMSV